MRNILIKQKKNILPVLVFSFFFLIYLSSGGGHVDQYDGVINFLITENFVLNGSPSLNVNSPSALDLGADIERIIQFKSFDIAEGEYYRIFGTKERTPEQMHWVREFRNNVNKEEFFGPTYLVLPTIAVPLYLISSVLGLPVIHIVPLFLNSSILAVSCVVIFLLGKKIFDSEKIGFILSLIFGLTSFIWPYITSMFANLLAILFVILSIYFILSQKNRHGVLFSFFAGLSIGLSFLSHTWMLHLVPGLLIFGIVEFRKNKKQLAMLGIAFLIIVGIQLYLNYMRFGHVDEFGFGYLDNIPEEIDRESSQLINISLLNGMTGYLFSPGLNIFMYFPVFVLMPIGFYYLYRRNKGVTILLIYITAVTFLYMATYPDWWYRNPHWGPHRYLLPLIPAVTLSIGSLISEFSTTKRLKIGLILLSVIGFSINLLGNLVWVQYGYAYGWGPEGLWKVHDKDVVFAWNPYYSQPMQAIKVLSEDWVGQLKVNPETLDFMKIGLHGCTFDIYFYCEYGILAIVLIGSIVAVIGYFIAKILLEKKLERYVRS